MKICSVEGCTRKHNAHGFCDTHEKQNKKHGMTWDYSLKNPNVAHFYNGKCFIELRNRYGELHNVAIIDKYDAANVLNHKWYLSKRGYPVSRINKKLVCLHTFITEDKGIDHKDRDKLNNCRNNLRKCSLIENTHNSSPFIGTSKYKGVWYDSHNKRYCTTITCHGMRIWGGRYKDEQDAALAYNELSVNYHGEFGVLNEVF